MKILKFININVPSKKMNERKTEDLVRDFFKKCLKLQGGEKATLYEQKTDIPKIQKLLSNASKSGKGKGYPEFIITFPSPYSDLLIVIECKADVRKHVSKTKDQYSEYAVDGGLLYASFLSKEYDVICIAVSGQTKKELKISNFLHLKKVENAKPLKCKELVSLDNFLDLYLYDEDKEKQSFDSLLDYSRKLNEDLRDIDLAESHRPLLVSGILIALDDSAFKDSYKKETRPHDLAKSLVDTIVKILDKSNIQGNKKANMTQSYGFIKTHSILASSTKKDGKYNTELRDLIAEINDNVKSFTKTYQYYDVLGKFYAEFLRYANGDKTLGIVLTPQHTTELFVSLAEVNEKSIIYDNCCGTGGFLISAMKKMLSDCSGITKKEKEVYEKRLIGVESNSNMFSLACSNMMIRGDGKANIYYDSCFDLVDEIKKYKPTVGFLNPPYSKKKEPAKEINFIVNNLESLEVNSTCIAIVPISCAIDDPLKEKLLEKHTLEAVMSMPEDLFHDSKAGTVTCIMVLKAHVPHEQSNRKTWLGYWRDDGFVKRKVVGRIDYFNRWIDVKKKWVDAFLNREEIKGFSLMKKLTPEDEWCAEAYFQTDYKEIKKNEFEDYFKRYLTYKLINSFEDEESEEDANVES